MFRLHEQINKMLNKNLINPSNKEKRYEHFRARCTEDVDTKISYNEKEKTKNQENVILVKCCCIEPLFGEKNQSV